MNDRFPVLSLMSMLVRGVGWLCMLAALFVAGARIAGQIGDDYNLMGMTTFVIGIVTVAFGEVVGVLFAIEKNTRIAAERLDE